MSQHNTLHHSAFYSLHKTECVCARNTIAAKRGKKKHGRNKKHREYVAKSAKISICKTRATYLEYKKKKNLRISEHLSLPS
jgi:hypothetical protein